MIVVHERLPSERFTANVPKPAACGNSANILHCFLSCSFVGALSPLSDGLHYLSTDLTDMLSLGIESAAEPHRMIWKLRFIPPVPGATPRAYASNLHPTSGPIVAAVYGDRIMVYTIPSDVFDFSTNEQRANTDEQDTADPIWLKWWPEEDSPVSRDDTTTQSN